MNRLRFEILEPRLCLATATWIGSASIDFDEPLNWNPNQVPDADDEVYFSGFAAAMFVHDAHTDRIVVKHGDANFNLAGSFYNALSSVPSEIGTVGQAKLLVYGSGTLNTDETVYVGSQADGEVTLMDPGTIWNHQTVVAIGDDGTGTVDVTAGSYFVSEGVEVAVNDAGSLTVDDATGIFDWLTVGNATNTGTFVTQNNGTVNVGELETGKSTIKILDFAVVSADVRAVFGYFPSTTTDVEIIEGALNTGKLVIAGAPNSLASVLVGDDGQVDVDGEIKIADRAGTVANLTVSGRVDADTVRTGINQGSDAELQVEDDGLFVVDGDFSVAEAGTVRVFIEPDGEVATGAVDVTKAATGRGTIDISGIWTAPQMNIGINGPGTVRLLQNGRLNAAASVKSFGKLMAQNEITGNVMMIAGAEMSIGDLEHFGDVAELLHFRTHSPECVHLST